MKLVVLNATPFAKALKELLGTLIATHPDKEQILDGVIAGRLSLRVLIDQGQNALTLTTQEDGSQRLVATVDTTGDASGWKAIFPDWNAEPPPIDATLH